MKLPQYWSKSIYRASDGSEYAAWGWSTESREDAEAMAALRAEGICKRLSKGEQIDRYHYGELPMREELLEVVAGSIEEPMAVVTRNSHGCRVLNTSGAMFIDVDLPRPGFLQQLRHWSLGLFMGYHENNWFLKLLRGEAETESPEEQIEREAIGQAEQLVQADPNCGIRIYRTHSGLRYLLTHTTFKPASDGAAQLMEFVEADPLYQRLCRTQDCFRARLTPKPWRCGQEKPPSRYPWPDEHAEVAFRRWEEEYEAKVPNWATCELIQVLGSTEMDPVMASMVKFHDRETRAESGLELA